jgi:hypothetical protein
VLLSLAALALPGAGAAGARSHRACDPRHSYTLTANSEVRVYVVLDKYGFREAWACYRGSERRFDLGSYDPHDPDYPYHLRVRLAGRLVGALTDYNDRYGEGDFHLVVRDVKTGKILHRADKMGNSGYEGAPGWWPSRFVMDRAGSVAWTASASSYDGSYEYYVFRSDTTRWGEILDSGPEVDGRSLRRHGKTFTWTHGAKRRTARFVR